MRGTRPASCLFLFYFLFHLYLAAYFAVGGIDDYYIDACCEVLFDFRGSLGNFHSVEIVNLYALDCSGFS